MIELTKEDHEAFRKALSDIRDKYSGYIPTVKKCDFRNGWDAAIAYKQKHIEEIEEKNEKLRKALTDLKEKS